MTNIEGVSLFTPVSESRCGNGARYAYKARMIGFSFPVETEVHDFETDKGWNGISQKGPPHRIHWKFEPADEGTRFIYGLEFEIPIPVLGPLLETSFLKPQWEKIIRNSLQNLNMKRTTNPEQS